MISVEAFLKAIRIARSRPVGHIALGFSKEDESRLTSRIMAEIALEYMERMGIRLSLIHILQVWPDLCFMEI